MISDRYQFYIEALQSRDQGMLVLAGLVITALVWWSLLGRWPQIRRWLSWAAVVCYVVVLAIFTVMEVPSV